MGTAGRMGWLTGAGLAAVCWGFANLVFEAPDHRPEARLLSDADGALREIVIHHVQEGAAITDRVYRDLLRQLPGDVSVQCLTNAPAPAALALRWGIGPGRIRLIAIDHPMTCWSRDRWLAVAGTDGRTELLLPGEELGQDIWPHRRGDAQLGFDLAADRPENLRARRLELLFDGGDFVADAATVFVTPAVQERNVPSRFATARELHDYLRHVLGKRVVLLNEAPPHHAGMFMMCIGETRVLVGDPAAAWALLEGDAACLPPALGTPDLSSETQARFDAVADQCREAGYDVHRIPVLPATDGRTYLSYVNVIIDQRNGQRQVYMPVYNGVDTLNQAAAAVWRGLGYTVHSVNCTDAYPNFGSLRCLVNVLRRGD